MSSATPVDIGTLIVSTPGTLGGRPRIAGHRIGVHNIAIFARMGYSADDIVEIKYTHLTLAEVHAALAYYYANREVIDADIEEERLLHDQLAAEAQPLQQGRVAG